MKNVSSLPLPDQAGRDRFITELDVNFGVVAPAGVGKTHSIVSRIVAMARDEKAVERLASLVVVTYTNRAAQEMQRRARAAIVAETGNLEILGAFNRAFFGTIHSFCLRLLQSYGHFIGVSGQVQLLEDDSELWSRFAQSQQKFGPLTGEPWVRELLRHVPVTTLFALARQLEVRTETGGMGESCPAPDVALVLDFVPATKRGAERIAQDQAALRRWVQRWREGSDFLPLLSPTSASAPFLDVWHAAMEPLRQWLRQASLRVAAQVAEEYQRFRVTQGALTYQDQIALAAELLSHPLASRQIRRENYRIILDEAQDTDPSQFFVLLETAKDPEQPGDLPRAGHFAMVGDHQQSIYGKRADLATYRKLHEALTTSPTGGESRFTVTFRCAQRIVDFVNGVFPALFRGEGGQVRFVPLQAKPGASAGQVIRLPLPQLLSDAEGKAARAGSSERLYFEAGKIAEFIREAGLAGLRAREWGQVAILCPRKRWFAPLMDALRREGLAAQLHSVREVEGDSPVYAWTCALLWIMTHPRDSYEIAGVLREIFGISDEDLARFSQGSVAGLQIAALSEGRGAVAAKLSLLATLRVQFGSLPLRDAVRGVAEGVGLRERLHALPLEWEAEEIDRELDDLFLAATAAENDGVHLREFARQLKDDFARTRESDFIRRDAVQLMTCQKAKGLEWDAVIVPFLFQKIGSSHPRYPLCAKRPGEAEPLVLLDGQDADEERKELVRLADWQETERVLYVTCTRARETLVLVDDEELFGAKEKSYPCFGKMLLPDEANVTLWHALPERVQAAPVQSLKQAQEQPELNFNLNRRIAVDLAQARKQAADFPRRITPHALAQHFSAEEPEWRADRIEEPAAADLQTAATLYGTWWHELMESIPWREPVSNWQTGFERTLSQSVDWSRASREWTLFLQSELARQLNRADWIFQPEMPFLWRGPDGNIIEGVMDLAVFDPGKKEWFVVDWKTNRLGKRGVGELAEIYRGQVEAYLQALGELFHQPVHGILYSTTLGQSLEVKPL